MMSNRFPHWILVIALFALQACSGGSGTPPTVNPASGDGGGNGNAYTGPEPQTADVQAFRIHVWENLRDEDRCGGCHTAGGQSPSFVRTDDVNMAYSAANGIVDLGIPVSSRMVTKVAEGHNCWQGSDSAAVSACATIIEGYITDWANDTQGGSANVIALTPPPIKDAGASKNYPSDVGDTSFASTVHPLLTAHCVNCHTPDASIPQTPYFAVSDAQDAYEAAQSKMDLDTPANSRFVLRLRNEFHNCWTTNCQNDANDMQAQITAMADGIAVTQPDPALVLSKALTLSDGIVANSGGRHEDNVIAKFEFQSGEGSTAFDTSGVSPDLNLTLSGNVEWVGGWGIRIIDGKAQGTTGDSRKLYDLISATGEYSIEAWVAPGNVTQGDAEDPARIVSYSAGTDARNFTLGQTQYNYEFLNRSSNTNANGTPAMATDSDDEDLQATLQHVVVTYDPVDGREIYVNGISTGDSDPTPGGTLADWNDTYAFVLGNEVSSNRLWDGVIRMVAIHNRVLNPEQVRQNYDVGVGQKFFMLFSISDLVNTPESYIVFEVSQFDSYSYLFNQPYYVTLDSSASPDAIALQGMRIGINGRETPVGQSFASLDTTITENNQVLSTLGTIIGLEKGADADEFFLTFSVLGSNSNVTVPGTPVVIPASLDGQGGSEIGVRTFDAISATMAEITGVNIAGEPALQSTFSEIRKALPAVADIATFLSSHQMSITQLGIGYCDALVESNPGFFPGMNFDASLLPGQRNLVTGPMVNAVIGSGISSQPDPAAAEAELDTLFDRLCGGTGSSNATCSASQTRPAAKGVCAAALGSAAMLIQ